MVKQSAIHYLSTTPGIAICGRFTADIIRGGSDDHSSTKYVLSSVIVEDPEEVTCKMCLKLLPQWRGITRGEQTRDDSELDGDNGDAGR